MPQLYHVGFRVVSNTLDVNKLETQFSELGDWARLNAYNWYLSSDYSAQQIYERLKVAFPETPDDHIVIIAADPSNFYGWAPQWFWDWLNAKRKST